MCPYVSLYSPTPLLNKICKEGGKHYTSIRSREEEKDDPNYVS